QTPDVGGNFTTRGVPPEPRPTGRTRGGGGGGGAVGAAGILGGRVKIENGVVTYESRARGATEHYRVEGLDLALTGGPQGALTFKGDAKVKPGDVTVKISDGSLAMNGARTLADASVDARVSE